MAWSRPSLSTLIKRNESDIETSLPGVNAKVRRTNLNVIAKLIAGTAHGLYGYIAYIAKQILPDTADTAYLDRQASMWLSVPRKAASYAVGSVNIDGTNDTIIPAGTILVRAGGAEYATDAETTIAGGTVAAAITALEAGQVGNVDAGTTLTLTSPIAGITSTATVGGSALTGGADQEINESLRARVLNRIQEPPHGGASNDYTAWALEVAGVSRAWVYPQELGAGTVTVRFVRDDDTSLVPDAAEVASVQDYIDARRPVTADVNVVAPVAAPLNFSIALTPNNASVQAAVEAELRDLTLRESIPSGTILLSHIREAISIAAGETDFDMSAPTENVTTATGEMATFGVITWL